MNSYNKKYQIIEMYSLLLLDIIPLRILSASGGSKVPLGAGRLCRFICPFCLSAF